MAEVTLLIGDREHKIACKDGDEAQVRRIGAKLDARWAAAHRASGGLNAERSMLFIALMLADALDEAEQATRTAVSEPGPGSGLAVPVTAFAPFQRTANSGPDLNELADRLEAIALSLENPAPSA